MKKLIYFALPMAFLMACGSDEAAEEVVKLETFKDRLSYALGAEQGKMIIESGDPNLAKLDFDKIVEGFEVGIKSDKAFDDKCKETFQKLYGPYGQDFDTNYLDAGCICTGKLVGSMFNKTWSKKGALDKVDFAMVTTGFKHAMEKRDTLLKLEERSKIVNDFVVDINKKSSNKLFANAKKLPNIQVLPDGLIIQTLQEGTGGSPAASDDVTADYILTSAEGDTIESSFEYKKQGGETPSFNLNGVIRGWTEAFPLMKKGGKYRLFVPGELAYGPQKGFESLCFYIEFHNFGAAGTLAKPRPQQ